MSLGPLVEKLKNIFGEKLRENAPTAPLTTYKIGGTADWLFAPSQVADLQALMEIITGHDVPVTILGGGSNTLVGDGGIRGVTIYMGESFKQISHQNIDGEIFLSCGASLEMAKIIDYCIQNDIAGLEFASGIPGSLGGALRGNAGTRDGAIGDVAHQISYVDHEGLLVVLPRENIEYRYRGLELKGRSIITSAVLKLKVGSGEKLRLKREKIINWRHSRQPYDMPSAGCVFINPEKASAGRLIDEAGCKGMVVGKAEVSAKHANFIVNTGGATASDVLELIKKIRDRVFEKEGILLETEIKIVGESK